MGFILVAPDEVVGDSDAAVEKMPHCGLFWPDFRLTLYLEKRCISEARFFSSCCFAAMKKPDHKQKGVAAYTVTP
jgi:hypothetical protein